MSSMTAPASVLIVAACAWSAACGRAPTPPKTEAARRPAACSLITREEMAEILKAPIGTLAADDTAAKTSCAYPPGEAGSWAQAEVLIEWNDRGGPTFGKQMSDAFGGSAVGRQVAHTVDLGDDAVYSSEGVLTIHLGTALITVTLPMRADSETRATAVGTKLLERLGGSVPATVRTPPVPPANKAGATPAVAANDTEDALKGLLALFGDDDKPEVKKAAPVSLPLPEGFEPGGFVPRSGAGH